MEKSHSRAIFTQISKFSNLENKFEFFFCCSNLLAFSNSLHYSVAALFVVCIVDHGEGIGFAAALRIRCSAAFWNAFIFIVPASCWPEKMIVSVENVNSANVSWSKHLIALAKRASASSSVVCACRRAILHSEAVFDKLADAIFSELVSRTFEAFFVLLADRIKGINRRALSHVTHRSITKH